MKELERIYTLTEQKKAIEKELESLFEIVEKKGITKQGNYALIKSEQHRREVIVPAFVKKYGKDILIELAVVPVTKAEQKLGKLPEEITSTKLVVVKKVVKV